MRTEFTNDISKPIFSKSVTPEEYVALLSVALSSLTLNSTRRNEQATAIKKLSAFTRSLPSLNPDELFLSNFKSHLVNQYGEHKTRYCDKFVSIIRSLTNSIPNIKRQIIDCKQFKKAKRFARYTPLTQKILKEFLLNGKKAIGSGSKLKLSTASLAESTRNSSVAYAMTFLDAIDKGDITKITQKDIDKLFAVYKKTYSGDRTPEEQCNQILCNLNSLFRYLLAKGIIKKNLVEHIKPTKCVNDDYVIQSEMNKLLDFSYVDWDDFFDVRDRLITVCLYYDFAVRNTEATLLNVADIKFNKYLSVFLRKEAQEKRQNVTTAVRDLTLYHFFEESRELMEAYLKMRDKRKPATNALLLSERNTRLGSSGCQDAVKKQCEKLGVQTYQGKTPSCHTLRTSMGTLNISPLGKNIDINSIKTRLRHTSVRTTETSYITNNPLLQAEAHDIHMKRNGNGSSNGSGNGDMSRERNTEMTTQYICEIEAMRALQTFSITPAALKKYAKANGYLKMQNTKALYSEKFINRLRDNYITKKEAVRMLEYTLSGFAYWVKRNGIEQIIIGNTTLLKLRDVREKGMLKERG